MARVESKEVLKSQVVVVKNQATGSQHLCSTFDQAKGLCFKLGQSSNFARESPCRRSLFFFFLRLPHSRSLLIVFLQHRPATRRLLATAHHHRNPCWSTARLRQTFNWPTLVLSSPVQARPWLYDTLICFGLRLQPMDLQYLSS